MEKFYRILSNLNYAAAGFCIGFMIDAIIKDDAKMTALQAGLAAINTLCGVWNGKNADKER